MILAVLGTPLVISDTYCHCSILCRRKLSFIIFSVTASIPFSLSLGIIGKGSQQINQNIRLQELKEVLLDRGFPSDLVNRGVEKAIIIPRNIYILKVQKLKIFPKAPNIPKIQMKH